MELGQHKARRGSRGTKKILKGPCGRVLPQGSFISVGPQLSIWWWVWGPCWSASLAVRRKG